MDTPQKTIFGIDVAIVAAIAGILTAIIAISSNAIGHVIKLRRERRVILRKALLNLLEIRGIVESAHTARIMKDSMSSNSTDPLGDAIRDMGLQGLDSVVFDGTQFKRQSIYDRFKSVVQDVGGENPILAVELSSCDMFLHQLDVMQQKWLERQKPIPDSEMQSVPEAIVANLVALRGPELPSMSSISRALDQLDRFIEQVSKECGRKVIKDCRTYLEKKNKHRDREKESVREPLGKGVLERLHSRMRLVRLFYPGKDNQENTAGSDTE